MYGEIPMVSYRQKAKEVDVSRWTIAHAVKDFGMRSFVRHCRALISAKVRSGYPICFYIIRSKINS